MLGVVWNGKNGSVRVSLKLIVIFYFLASDKWGDFPTCLKSYQTTHGLSLLTTSRITSRMRKGEHTTHQ